MTHSKQKLSETMVARLITKAGHPDRSRSIENSGFLVAVIAVSLYALSDFLIRIGVVKPSCTTGVPWVLLILVGCLILPKTVGRATTGRLWTAAIDKWGSKP